MLNDQPIRNFIIINNYLLYANVESGQLVKNQLFIPSCGYPTPKYLNNLFSYNRYSLVSVRIKKINKKLEIKP